MESWWCLSLVCIMVAAGARQCADLQGQLCLKVPRMSAQMGPTAGPSPNAWDPWLTDMGLHCTGHGVCALMTHEVTPILVG